MALRRPPKIGDFTNYGDSPLSAHEPMGRHYGLSIVWARCSRMAVERHERLVASFLLRPLFERDSQ